MNAVALLLGLLVLSYLGSMLAGQRSIQGFGLPSGAEYWALGFVLGSHVLGIISPALLESFEPLLVVGGAWIAFVTGVGYTQVGRRRIAVGRALLGIVATSVVGAVVGLSIWFVLPLVVPSLASERLLLALGIAIVCSASTRQAVRWVAERHAASGPLSDALADYARSSSLVPIFGLSVLLAFFPAPTAIPIDFWQRVAMTWITGASLGLVALLLVGRGLRRDEVWGILVGTSLLSMGVAARLNLSAIAAAFGLGLTLGVLSPRRTELAAMLRPTERAVLLPLAVLAGALINLREAPGLWLLVPLALVARLAGEFLRGLLLMAFSRPARAAGPLVGFSLSSTGDVTLACSVSLAVAFDHPAARSLLVVAATAVLSGELLGPLALKRSLGRAGELGTGGPVRPSIEPLPDDSLA